MDTIKHFKAACVNCYEEDDVLTIGVGDDACSPQNFVIMGRFDEDDLSVNECIGFQSNSTTYEITDAIQTVKLTTNTLLIVLNDSAAKKVGVREFHGSLSSEKDVALLREYLEKIFEGSDVDLQLA